MIKGRGFEERTQGDKQRGGRVKSGEIQLKINLAMLFLSAPLCQEPNGIVPSLKMAVTADTDTQPSLEQPGSAA